MPAKATTYRKSDPSTGSHIITKHLPSKALLHFVEADMTRKQYEVTHAANKNIYSCYSLLRKVKQECYPPEESIHVTETRCDIKLQNLLDHTSAQLCEYLDEVLENLNEVQRKNLELLSKWGCDGSQQQTFKQKFQNSTDSDENVFQCSFVPLRLICHIDSTENYLAKPSAIFYKILSTYRHTLY